MGPCLCPGWGRPARGGTSEIGLKEWWATSDLSPGDERSYRKSELCVAANRSRTDRWRQSLQQICERNGAIEITFPGSKHAELYPNPESTNADEDQQSNLIWRVRLLAMTDDELVIEQPSAMGVGVNIEKDVELVGILTVGQNRWMFHTRVLDRAKQQLSGHSVVALRLVMPQKVERCQRRDFFRISTAALSLPKVECWPLIDPATVVTAEMANRNQIIDLLDGGSSPKRNGVTDPDEPLTLPEVGPKFNAKLINVSGGGIGLMIDRDEASAVDRTKLFWIRVDLRPHVPAPVGMTTRLAHTHMDSTQHVYAGLAFEFDFNPTHRAFVVDQICRYVTMLQREQLQIAKQRA